MNSMNVFVALECTLPTSDQVISSFFNLFYYNFTLGGVNLDLPIGLMDDIHDWALRVSFNYHFAIFINKSSSILLVWMKSKKSFRKTESGE